MHKFPITIAVFLILSSYIFAQPEWITKTPPGYLNDYYVGVGSSNVSKSNARQSAFENAIGYIMRNNSMVVDYSESDTTLSNQTSTDNNINLNIVRKTAQELNMTGESKTIKDLKEVETYYETNGNTYEAWVLVKIPKKNAISPPSAFSPVWRSILLPGWGQLYNGDTFKGVSFMMLTLGSVASGLVFNQLSISDQQSALSSRTQARRDFFNQQTQSYNTYSIISYIAAGIFYSWNLIDAITIDQKNYYVMLMPSESSVNVQFIINF